MNNYFAIKNDLATGQGQYYPELTQEQLKKLQLSLLQMYSDVLEICEENNIKPFLLGGTLLGKVRHNGFIPWDDDLDIGLSRKDYELFKMVFPNKYSNKYLLVPPGSDNGSHANFIKVYKIDSILEMPSDPESKISKIFLDVFPLDFTPNNKIVSRIKGIFCDFILGCISSKRFCKTMTPEIVEMMKSSKRLKINYFTRKFLNLVTRCIEERKLVSMLDRLIQHNKKSRWCTIAVGRKHYIGEMLPESVFYPLKESSFCGIKTWLPNRPDTYLKNLYGNYLEIPEIDKREHHYVKRLMIGSEEIV